jgi:hypothetical protein
MSYMTRDRSYKGEIELSYFCFDYTVYVEAEIEDSYDTDNPWESSFEVKFKEFSAYYEENENGELVEKEETDESIIKDLKELAEIWLGENT